MLIRWQPTEDAYNTIPPLLNVPNAPPIPLLEDSTTHPSIPNSVPHLIPPTVLPTTSVPVPPTASTLDDGLPSLQVVATDTETPSAVNNKIADAMNDEFHQTTINLADPSVISKSSSVPPPNASSSSSSSSPYIKNTTTTTTPTKLFYSPSRTNSANTTIELSTENVLGSVFTRDFECPWNLQFDDS